MYRINSVCLQADVSAVAAAGYNIVIIIIVTRTFFFRAFVMQ